MMTQPRQDFEGMLSRWAFPGLLSLVMGFVTMQMNGIKENLDTLNAQIKDLSTQTAVILERNAHSDKEHQAYTDWLEDLEKRIQALERNR